MAIQIVTGRTGEPHLDIYEISSLLRDICGKRLLVCEQNNKLAIHAEQNTVVVESGAFFLQGAYMRIPLGQTETAVGTLSNDENFAILYVHYEQDVNTGIDSAEFRLYNGSMEDYIEEHPLSTLESGSKIIDVALWTIDYTCNGNEAVITNYDITPYSAYLHSLSYLFNEEINGLTTAYTRDHATLNEINNYIAYEAKRCCNGTTTATPTAVNAYSDHRINFPTGFFSSKPVIFINALTGVPDAVHVAVKEYTKDYFIYTFKRTNNKQSTTICWHAEER